MVQYHAPIRDMGFVIRELAGLDQVAALPAFRDAEISAELAGAVLEEAGKLAGHVLSPINPTGDREGCRLDADGVHLPASFVDAYRQYVEGGWNGLGASPEYGGQGLPELLNTATHEMWSSANVAFALGPMLTAGAIEAIRHHGSDTLKALYLPKLVAGQWSGTMNLTEPQAGSDLSAVRTRAVPEGNHFRLYGQKIFITWGDHDAADNIIHLVLARTPDAPEGVKGISLFLVPKFLPDAAGAPGERNDVRCVSLEHKLGIHASPTCVMSFGDHDGAIGYLVGEENRGLAHMFTMMNEARLKVGLQGLAIAEMAYQQALGHARERVQGRPAGRKEGERVTIIHHPDVRRMLMQMKSQIEAMRALAYVVAGHMDMARHHPEEQMREAHQVRVDLLIPVVKGWLTELGVEVSSLGVQVHGGMGYIEETGAAQHLRDARIAPIYEGTNGIQAADLVGRKLAMDGGRAMREQIEGMRATVAELGELHGDDMRVIHGALAAAADALAAATDAVLSMLKEHPAAALAASFEYMMLAGYSLGGWHMARAAVIAHRHLAAGEDTAFHETKLLTARHYSEHVLVKAHGLADSIGAGSASILALDAERF